jgi:hypothetical protein
MWLEKDRILHKILWQIPKFGKKKNIILGILSFLSNSNLITNQVYSNHQRKGIIFSWLKKLAQTKNKK